MRADEQAAAFAETLATWLHRDQVDKAGLPYVSHLRRVARYAYLAGGDATSVAVAWLHDAIEDGHVAATTLRAIQIPHPVVDAVLALTFRDGFLGADRRDQYLRWVALNPTAWLVKCADVTDNADPARLARLDRETADRLARKYAHARDVLTEDGRPWPIR